MDTTRDLTLPSGWEAYETHALPRSGFRGKLDTLKSRGLEKVHDIQRVVNDRSLVARDGAKSQVTKVQSSMRTSPMTWAGIAAGSGLVIGLIGRIAQARSKRRSAIPTLVIVEAC